MHTTLFMTALTAALTLLPAHVHAKGPHVRSLWESPETFSSTPTLKRAPAVTKKSVQGQQHIEFISRFGDNPKDKRPALAYAKRHNLMNGTLFIQLLPRTYCSDPGFQKEAFQHFQNKQRHKLHGDRMAHLRSRFQLPSSERDSEMDLGDRPLHQRIQDLRLCCEGMRAQLEASLKRQNTRLLQDARHPQPDGFPFTKDPIPRTPYTSPMQATIDALSKDIEGSLQEASAFLQTSST